MNYQYCMGLEGIVHIFSFSVMRLHKKCKFYFLSLNNIYVTENKQEEGKQHLFDGIDTY